MPYSHCWNVIAGSLVNERVCGSILLTVAVGLAPVVPHGGHRFLPHPATFQEEEFSEVAVQGEGRSPQCSRPFRVPLAKMLSAVEGGLPPPPPDAAADPEPGMIATQSHAPQTRVQFGPPRAPANRESSPVKDHPFGVCA
jgi:hypothetical protein